MSMVPHIPSQPVHTLRRDWLPEFPDVYPKYWYVRTYYGNHPTLPGLYVWWRAYLPTLYTCFELAYGEALRRAIRENPSWLELSPFERLLNRDQWHGASITIPFGSGE
jgi:hypothetical protein